MIKRNPTYRVTVYTQNETVIVEYPLTCHFNVTRSMFSQSAKASIQLYNLAQSTRTKIFKDALTLDAESWKFVKLEAGYNGVLSEIFFGRILQAYSSKSGGQVDVITTIDAQALDIFDCQSSYTFEAGTSYKDAYKTMAADMPNIQIGNIGTLEGTFKTKTTFDGNTLDCLNQLTGGNTYVDNGVLNTIMNNEVIKTPVPLVTDDNGLLETPIRRSANLDIKMLFEPTLVVGQLMEIKSGIADWYNGQYKVLGFTHDCMISPTQAGNRITTVNLWIAPLLTSTDINVTGEGVTGGAAPVSSFNEVEGERVTPAVAKGQVGSWIMPAKGRISSSYGWRIHPISKERKWHNGIDIAAPLGAIIKAPAAGTVYYVGYENKLNGNTIRIDHGLINGVRVLSVFIHLRGFNVANNQKVKQGQQIGTVGSTGNSTGPHLHISIYEGRQGKDVNPLKYIDKSKY